MIEVRGLTKRFRSLTVVDHVSFTVRRGEITGYLGPNGSGKSTTVKMLTGLVHPTEGQILFNGRDIRENITGFRRFAAVALAISWRWHRASAPVRFEAGEPAFQTLDLT